MDQRQQSRYPRVRVDALTDGIFAVAMTILVLDIRIPETAAPASSAQLIQELWQLWPKFLPYVMSFMILGLRWLSVAGAPVRIESFGGTYIRWWLIYLLLITCIPFTTMVVGRFATLEPAVWLYCANTALVALASWRMAELSLDMENAHHLRERRISMAMLFASSMLCVAISFIAPRHALWAFVLNLAAPVLARSGRHNTREFHL